MPNWLGERVSDFHDFTKKYDPVGHYAVEWPLKAADWSVKKTSEGLGRAARKIGVNSHLPDMVAGQAGENQGNFGQSAIRHLGSAAAIYGGMMGLGAGGGSSAGGGAAEGAGGGFLGEGVASGVPAWDGAAGGAGLGFDAGGLPGGASMASDFPTQGMGKGGMGNMTSLIGQGGGQQQVQYGSGRQNLPLFQNEKTDQQKLAELLKALQDQQGYA